MNLKVGDTFILNMREPREYWGGLPQGARCEVISTDSGSHTQVRFIVFDSYSSGEFVEQELVRWEDARPLTKLERALK